MNINALLQQHPYVFPLFFAGMWLCVTCVLRFISGFSWKTTREYDLNKTIASRHWCSARISSVNFSNCLSIYRLEHGFLVRISWLFLGGSRYIDDNAIVIDRQEIVGLAFTERPVLHASIHGKSAIFYGKAAEFITQHTADNANQTT